MATIICLYLFPLMEATFEETILSENLPSGRVLQTLKDIYLDNLVVHFFANYSTFYLDPSRKLSAWKRTHFYEKQLHPVAIPFPARVILFTKNYPENSTGLKDRFTRNPPKYFTQHDILITPFYSVERSKSPLKYALFTFSLFAMETYSIILVVNFCSKCGPEDIIQVFPDIAFVFPAVKIITSLLEGNTCVSIVHSNNSVNTLECLFSNLQTLHKTYFSKYSTKTAIQTLLQDDFDYLKQTDSQFCMKSSSIVVKFCTYEVMAILAIHQHHNMTLQITNRDEISPTGRSSIVRYDKAYIDTLITRHSTARVGPHQVTGMSYNKFKVTTISYCIVNLRGNAESQFPIIFNYKTWTKGFCLEMWISLCVCVIICAVILSGSIKLVKILGSIFEILGFLFREGKLRNMESI